MKISTPFKILAFLSLILIISCTSSEKKIFIESDILIIPKPEKTVLKDGSFEFTKNTKIFISNENQIQALNSLINKISTSAGYDLDIIKNGITPNSNYIQLIVNDSLPKDAYELTIDTNKIVITAGEYGGFLYGLESLIQLLPIEIETKRLVANKTWLVPNILIQDQPRFEWRGLMLDISRHFFDKDYIKEVIDGLAMHKMNVLHLHLVDDQGWRIEIKKYPKLTEVGAYRINREDAHWNARKSIPRAGETGTYGGFLTQDDLKELVKYAQEKNIEIIPEIEMPAHVMSAIASYPELSCFGKPINTPSGGVWPITEIYCAGKESTFEFLENVLLEVMEIFPSKYIHIGGDEATKTNWKICKHCQARMKSEGLHDEEELQSYFIKRIEKFINAHGRNLVGWDEILEGGLAPEATVMSWRGVKGGLEAAAQGHDVVMTPGSHCYFDHYQGPQSEEPLAFGGYLPLSKVYEFDPIVESMTEEEAAHILGGQANLWSEYVPTDEHSEYMIYPRIAALAETVWSPKKLRNWDDFSVRIISMLDRYKLQGINYAKSAFLVTTSAEVNLESKTVRLTLKNEFPNSDVRYVLGDKDLSSDAVKYKNPIEVNTTTVVKASLFKYDKPIGKAFIDTIKFHKAVAHKVKYLAPYSDKYQGAGEFGMVNTIRGTKNFHDGQWQAWLSKDMELIIDLEKEQEISQVVVGAMENQGPGIYFPTSIEILVSNNGESYESVGTIKRAYAKNSDSELKDFKVKFKSQKTKFVKVIATNLKKTPSGGGVWLFIDEIVIE